MMKKIARILLLLTLVLVAAACSGDSDNDDSAETITQPENAAAVEDAPAEAEVEVTAPDTPTDDVVPEAEVAATETPSEEAPAEPVIERPAWQTFELVDARTGATFTLADFAGKTVFVEPMATWCTNCRAQLGRVRQARTQLDGEAFVFIALSLETNIGNDSLAIYADREGFNWTFAVMPEAFLGMLRDEFGRAVSTAPSTPHFVIRPDGSYTDLRTGAKSVEDIVAEMVENASEGEA